jgi:Fibronectin type III domain
MKSQDGWASMPIGNVTNVAGRNKTMARRRNVGRIAGTSITAILATTLAPWATSPAFAAVPLAPANITVFPNRDFVELGGYENRAGDPVTITVTRAGVVTGSAAGNLNAEGGLEVNHPGGVCWGTNPAEVASATPDIQAGDIVTALFDDGTSDTVTAQSPTVTSSSRPALTPNTVVVLGTLGAPGQPVANPAQMEQRIKGAALTTTDVGANSVRAMLGPMVTDSSGAYSSSLAVTGNNFTATYIFVNAATAAVAAGEEMRAMTWMAEDAEANRQGLTIAEFGLLGGPGGDGCPLGNPAATAPGTPGIGTATGANASALVRWNRPSQGSSVITGYSIQVLNANGTQNGALRNAPEGGLASNARSFNVTGLTAGQTYSFQVRATNAAGDSGFSAPSNTVSATSVASFPVIVKANPGAVGGTVTARANWLPPASNGGSAITGYVVTAMRINARGSVMTRTNSLAQPSSLRSLSMTLPAGNYRFAVRARNAMGLSAYSTSSQVVGAR